MIRSILPALLLSILSGCAATPPAVYDFENSRTFMVEKRRVWDVLVSRLAERQLSIQTIEYDSGLIVAELRASTATEIQPAGGFDCPQSIFFTPQILTIRYNIFVMANNEHSSTVTANLGFAQTGINTLANEFASVACASTGVIETSWLDSINAGTREFIVLPESLSDTDDLVVR